MIISNKTITSIFFVPTLGINREDLFKNDFINAYLIDIDNEQYYEEEGVCFLLFKPKDNKQFHAFLEEQYEINERIIEDYDRNPYIILVYSLDEKWKKDFDIIKESKYSQVSKEFKDVFTKKIKLLNRAGQPMKTSLQWMIFEKDFQLTAYVEKKIGQELPPGAEIWPTFEMENEILDLEKIINQESK